LNNIKGKLFVIAVVYNLTMYLYTCISTYISIVYIY